MGAAGGVGRIAWTGPSIAGGRAPWIVRSAVRTGMVLAVVLSFALPACDLLDGSECPPGSESFVEYQLFMGRGGAAGEIVSDADWEDFLAASVTPRFPDGLTVLDGSGQWRDAAGQIEKERSKVLILYATGNESSLRADVDAISSEYEQRFDQESVLRVVDKACVSFS